MRCWGWQGFPVEKNLESSGSAMGGFLFLVSCFRADFDC